MISGNILPSQKFHRKCAMPLAMPRKKQTVDSTTSSTIETQSSNASLKRPKSTTACREPTSSASSIAITDNIQHNIFPGKLTFLKLTRMKIISKLGQMVLT
jgi:hypothetical protein